MGTVRVIFSRRSNVGSLILRTFLWSAWSHCGIVDGDEVIEAAMFRGVKPRSLAEFKANASKWEIVEIPTDYPAGVIAWVRGQIGADYDWPGAFGIPARRDWQLPGAWFCSELVAAAFAAAGTALFRVEVWRITPRDIYIRNY